AIKAGLVAIMNSVVKSVTDTVSRQNPALAQKQVTDVEEVVNEAMTERLDLLIDMSMVAALNTLSTDELVAMDKFYSTPEGVSILNKLPKIAAQMPAMMQAIIPDYLNEIRTKMKAKGTELKL
ncbi:MAG TPA: DUF2059 domain-containing protein, partial [Beijerinckiaceae bacterium]|nr:DUF2059 domain-containing protein [Beijerinckiaceae bacterium]